MKVSVATGCFADAASEELCVKRLTGVLARYAGLLRNSSIGPGPTAGLRVEVVFATGAQLTVEQLEVGDHGALIHLADRVGRAVARHVDLRINRGPGGLPADSKIPK